MISCIGIGTTLKRPWDVKLQFEGLLIPFATILCDTALYTLNPLCPSAAACTSHD